MQLRQTSVTSHTKLTQVKPKVNMLSIKEGRRVTGTMLQFNMYATKMIENVILWLHFYQATCMHHFHEGDSSTLLKIIRIYRVNFTH